MKNLLVNIANNSSEGIIWLTLSDRYLRNLTKMLKGLFNDRSWVLL